MGSTRLRASWASAITANDGRVVVCLQRDGAPRCYGFASLDALRQANEEGSLSVRRWALAVPGDSCIVKPLSLPTADFAEATTMVEFEIGSLVPLPCEAVTYGSTLLGRGEHLLSILVWILRREILENHLQPYRAIGIEPKGVIPDVAAIHRWFASAAPPAAGAAIYVLADNGRALVLIDTEGRLLVMQGMPLSQNDAASSCRDIALEILRLRQEHVPAPHELSVVLAGEEQPVAAIREHLCRLTQDHSAPIQPSLIPSPSVSPYPSDGDPQDVCGCAHEATAAVGLLELFTASAARHLNLLPREYLQRHEKRARLFRRLQWTAMGVLLASLAWGCLAATNWRLAKHIRLIEAQIAPIKHIAGTTDSKHQRVKAIQRQLTGRDLIGRTVKELYECTPQQISFCELRLTWTQDILFMDLRGQADMLSTAFEYTEAVRQAKLVHGLQIVNAQQIPQARGGSVVDFKANCTIRGD